MIGVNTAPLATPDAAAASGVVSPSTLAVAPTSSAPPAASRIAAGAVTALAGVFGGSNTLGTAANTPASLSASTSGDAAINSSAGEALRGAGAPATGGAKSSPKLLPSSVPPTDIPPDVTTCTGLLVETELPDRNGARGRLVRREWSTGGRMRADTDLTGTRARRVAVRDMGIARCADPTLADPDPESDPRATWRSTSMAGRLDRRWVGSGDRSDDVAVARRRNVCPLRRTSPACSSSTLRTSWNSSVSSSAVVCTISVAWTCTVCSPGATSMRVAGP